MTAALVISNLLLWVVVIVLAFAVYALARQVGILHERVAPAGALMPTGGLKVGEVAPRLELQPLAGAALEVGGERADGQSTLIFFLSPDCPICRELLPMVLSFARREAERLTLLFASDGGEREEHEKYVREFGLADYPYLLSAELGRALGVDKLPFAVLLDGGGILRAKGLVNSREQLESLLQAMDLGVGSLQEYLGMTAADAPPVNPPLAKEPT